MKKFLDRVPVGFVAYVFLLVAFVALGTSVYALAVGSPLSGALAATLVVCLATAALGFRLGARESKPRSRREEVDRYLLTYRGRQPRQTAVIDEPLREVNPALAA